MEVKFCWYFWDRFGFSVFGILDGKLSVIFFTSSITITFSSVKKEPTSWKFSLWTFRDICHWQLKLLSKFQYWIIMWSLLAKPFDVDISGVQYCKVDKSKDIANLSSMSWTAWKGIYRSTEWVVFWLERRSRTFIDYRKMAGPTSL